MGLLDFDDNFTPRFNPKQKRYTKQTAFSQEQRDLELNNHDHGEVTEDFSDSPYADRK